MPSHDSGAWETTEHRWDALALPAAWGQAVLGPALHRAGSRDVLGPASGPRRGGHSQTAVSDMLPGKSFLGVRQGIQ